MKTSIIINNELALRPLQHDDYHDIFRTIDTQRAHLGKWLPFVAYTQQPEDSKAFVESTLNAPKEKHELTFSIRKNDQFIGLIGFRDTDRSNHITEIGYWLSEKEQGHGYVTQAVTALCRLAFEEMNINRIQIRCAVENHKSRSIPERLGFRLEGIMRDGELLSDATYTDLAVYSLLKTDKSG